MNNKLREIIYKFPIHLKNYIILESNPDLADNTYALYKTLLENKVNEKYKIFWFVNDKSIYKNIHEKNVHFISYYDNHTFFEKLKSKYIQLTSKYIIDCNKLVYKKNIHQKRLYLSHGMPYKAVPEYCSLIGDVDYFLSLSPFFDDKLSELCNLDKNKFIHLGYPRNDDLFAKNTNINKLLKNKKYSKIIMWLPTYRQRGNKLSNLTMDNTFDLGIPIIYNTENLTTLNNLLKELDVLLVLKPHPAQDLSVINAGKLSNFIILTDDNLNEANINLYEFLSQTDALITDYSSVYYDYLLTNKPIAVTIDDFEEYKKIFNIVFDNIFEVIKGEYIKDFNHLLLFIQNVSSGNDVSMEERNIAKNKFHKFQDEFSSKRVYEFLVNKMGL